MAKTLCGAVNTYYYGGIFCDELKGHGPLLPPRGTNHFNHHSSKDGVWWNTDLRDNMSDKKKKKKPKKPVELVISENDLLTIATHVAGLVEYSLVAKPENLKSTSYLYRNLKVEVYAIEGPPGDLDFDVKITHDHEGYELPGYQEHKARVEEAFK